jgi:hypothetical protein
MADALVYRLGAAERASIYPSFIVKEVPVSEEVNGSKWAST